MEATPGAPAALPLLTAPLGGSAAHCLTITNPTPTPAHFSAASSDARRFSVAPADFVLPGGGSTELQVLYRPGRLGDEEAGAVTVASDTAGSQEYCCRGQVRCVALARCTRAGLAAALRPRRQVL